LSQVLGGSMHVQTLLLIFWRRLSHSAGALARVLRMADSSVLEGNRWPQRGQFCGLSRPTRVDLRGGSPERLEPGCGCRSLGLSMNSYGIPALILLWFCLRRNSVCDDGSEEAERFIARNSRDAEEYFDYACRRVRRRESGRESRPAAPRMTSLGVGRGRARSRQCRDTRMAT
jgi:hypothetical protein